MATRTNLPAAEVDGTPLPASWLNDLRGAFRILQVVYAQTTTAVGSTSASWIDTGLSASITPQSSTSRILIYASHSVYCQGVAGGGFLVMRNFTTLQTFLDVNYYSGGGNLVSHWANTFLDSPATTSAITYKTAQNRITGSGIFYTQVNSNPGTLVLMEVSA